MAIIRPAVRIIVRESSAYHFSGPALSLGVPEIHATYGELDRWIRELTGHACPLELADAELTTNRTGRRLGWVSSGSFFRSLGISDVSTMDIPGCEHPPDFYHDLNQPFPEQLVEAFNLILDPGTMEHVFDIKTGLANIVRALRVGGVVLHLVPIYSYNGGYFSINPNVLKDFYGKNGFAEQRAFIIMWDRYRPYTGKHRCYEYDDELLGERHALADFDQCRFTPHLLFMARKIEVLSQLHIPLQYDSNYVGEVKNLSIENGRLPIAQKFRRNLSFLQQYLPFHFMFFLTQSLKRNAQWIKTHRRSFWM